MINNRGYDDSGRKARSGPWLIAGRIGSFLFMASGVSVLLFARLFANLSALSSGFAERSRLSLMIGVVCWAVGFVLKLFIARRTSRERVDARWITEQTTVGEFTIESWSVPSTATSFDDALNARLQAAAGRFGTSFSSDPQSAEARQQPLSPDAPQQQVSGPLVQAERPDLVDSAGRLQSDRWPQTQVESMTAWQSPRIGAVERIVLVVFAAVVAGWLGFATVTYIVQDSLVFSPRRLDVARLERIAWDYPNAEEVLISVDGGMQLHGWLLPPAQASRSLQSSPPFGSPQDVASGPDVATDSVVDGEPVTPGTRVPLMIVFAGQGGEASNYFELAEHLPGLAWAFINYRGYGLSDGSPSDQALFHDAVALYDYFAARADIDGDNIFALGGSLGTGVATYLAGRRPLAGVVLFSPYDRIGGGVAQDLMPWIPTGVLFKNQFDAAAYAPDANAPALAIVGDADAVIRPERSRTLLREWGQPHRLIVVAGGDHYSVYENENAWRAIDGFVRGLLR